MINEIFFKTMDWGIEGIEELKKKKNISKNILAVAKITLFFFSFIVFCLFIKPTFWLEDKIKERRAWR